MRRDGQLGRSNFAGGVLAVAALMMLFGAGATNSALAQVPEAPPRIAFEIATGSTTGTYFPVGQSIAQLLSHPPGVQRCEAADACGPAGLIVSTRATAGSSANVVAVNSGMSNSALAQADAVAMAIAGLGSFAKTGRASSLRVIAKIYGEDVHLIAAKDAKISRVSDLRGKRVGLSTEGSGTIVTARAILSAYRLNERTIVPNYDPSDRAIDMLQSGQIDALFFVGGSPVNLIEQLLSGGSVNLVPIDGEGRDRLLMRQPRLSARSIPDGTYESLPAIDTVSVDALWVTNEAESDSLVYAMVKALLNPANHSAFEQVRAGAHFLDPAFAVPEGFPIHPGAMRYFVEAGLAKPPEVKDSPPPTGPLPNKS